MSRKWWYLREESELGPFDDREFRNAVREGWISEGTLVKSHVQGEWTPFERVAVPSASPPEPREELEFRLPVNDVVVWVLAALPVAFAAAAAARWRFLPDLGPDLGPRAVGAAYLATTLALLLVDWCLERSAMARPTGPVWGLLLVPAYLFKRRRLSDANQGPLVLHVLLLLASTVAAGTIAALDVKAAACDDREATALVADDLTERLGRTVAYAGPPKETDGTWRTWTVRRCATDVTVEGEEGARSLAYDVRRRWGRTVADPTALSPAQPPEPE